MVVNSLKYFVIYNYQNYIIMSLLQNTELLNIFAFVSVILYALTLTPSMLRIALPNLGRSKFNIYLTRKRRRIGIYAWLFGFLHGTLIIFQRQLDFSNPKIYIQYFQGLTLITIFTLLAITSNDLSQKKLKRHWKTLHDLTFVALFLLPWHILDKMRDGWSIFTALILSVLFVMIYLYGVRIYLKIKKNSAKKAL